jgi:uncharacterized protein
MNTKDFELRQVTELRVNPETRLITGTAIVFNSMSENMGFRELIKPEAITQDLINQSDIIFLVNHADGIPLARSNKGKGTLNIKVDSRGVHFAFRAKKTMQGDEVLNAIQSGDMSGVSFSFKVAPNGDKWSKLTDGQQLRTITKIGYLKDFSLVNEPAYKATEIQARKKTNPELEIYFKKYEDIISKLKNK